MDSEPPFEPTVERVEKPDGRYVLYFTWPEEPPISEPPAEAADIADE